MTLRSSVLRGCSLCTTRAGMLFAFVLLALFCARTGLAQTQATIVNPQNHEVLSSQTSVDLTQRTVNPGVFANYLLNGTCHQADMVAISITSPGPFLPAGGFTPVNDVATVKGGVWEYNWLFKQGLTSATAFTITVTPMLNGVAGTALPPITVTLSATFPGFSLSLVPSSINSHLYAGVGNAAGGTQPVGLRLRYYTNDPVGSPIGALSFTAANSNPTYFTPSNVPAVNNDDPAGNSLIAGTPSNAVPFTYTLGGAGGLVDGLNIIKVNRNGSPVAVAQRSIIIDTTPPTISAGGSLNYSFPSQNIVEFTGSVFDPDNGTGATLAVGGIASVELVIQAPGGAPARIPAKLVYGNNPSDPVAWTVDYNTSGLPKGNYKVYAVINDNAGNQTFDTAAGPVTLPTLPLTPYSVGIDQTAADVPTVSVTAPTNLFLRGAVSIGSSATANAIATAYNATTPILSSELHALAGPVGSLDTLIFASPGSLNGTQSPINWDTTKSKDGSYNLYLKATDAQANPGTSIGSLLAVVVDNTPPVITFTSPAANAYLKGASNTITAMVIDNNTTAGNTLTKISFLDDKGNPLTGVVTTQVSPGVATVTANFDTTPLLDGKHTLTLIVQDKAGNPTDPMTTGQLVVFVKNKKPDVPTITSPAAGPISSANIAITGTITDSLNDPTNIITYTIKDGGTTVGMGQSPPPVTFTGAATNLSEGSHTFTVTATDPANNTSSNSVTVLVDTTKPVAAITAVTRGVSTDTGYVAYTLAGDAVKEIVTAYSGPAATVSSLKLTISGTYTETNLASLSVLVDGVAQTSTTYGGGTFSVQVDTTLLTDGGHVITVKATDTAGNVNNVGTTAIRVTVENVYPNVVLTTPSNNTAVPAGVPVIGTITAGTDLLQLLAFPANPAAAYVTVPDPSAASSATMLFELLDGTVPIPNVLASQKVSVQANGGLFTLALPDTITDDTTHIGSSTINQRVRVTLTGSDLTTPVHTVNSTPIILTVLAPTVSIDEIDHPGFISANQATASTIAVTPVPTPIYVGGPITVLGKVGIANLQKWVLALNTSPATTPITIGSDTQVLSVTTKLNRAPNDPFVTSPTVTPDGTYTLTLTATDTSNNVSTDTKTLIIDNTAPVVMYTTPTPSANAVVQNQGSSLLTIAVTVVETNLASWDVLIDGVSQHHATTGPFTWTPGASINLVGNYLADGTHSIEVVVLDLAGNKGSSGVRQITVDNTNPAVTVSAPTTGSFLRGTVQIAGNIVDANPLKWELDVNAMVLVPDTMGTGTVVSYSWNTTQKVGSSSTPMFPDGVYVIKVKATDKAGNVGDNTVNSPVSVTIDNTAPVATVTAVARTGAVSPSSTPAVTPTTYTIGTGTGGAQVNQFVRDTLTISGTYVETNLDVATTSPPLTVLIDGRALTTTYDDTKKTFTATWDTTSTTLGGDGKHVISVYVRDKAGNLSDTTANSVSVIVDNTPPQVVVTSPYSSVPVLTTITGTVSSAHLGSTAYFVFLVHSPGSPDPFNTPPLGTVDTLYTATAAQILANPALAVPLLPSQYAIVPGILSVQSGSTQTYTVPFPAKFKNGAFIQPGTPIDIRVFADDVTTPPNRGVSQPVSITSAAGQGATIDKFSEYDGDAPKDANGIYYLHSAQHQSDGTFAGTVPVSILGTVNVASLSTYTINVRDSQGVVRWSDVEGAAIPLGQPITASSKLNPSKNFDTTTLVEGAYTVDILATDLGGNQFSFLKLASLIVDNTPPGLTPGIDPLGNHVATTPAPGTPQVAPINFLPIIGGQAANGSFLKAGSYLIGANVSDNTAGANNFITTSILLDGKNSQSASPPFGTLSVMPPTATPHTMWNVSSSVGEGQHIVTVTAVDEARNTSSKSITVTVDVTPPTVQINFPTNLQYVSGTVNINATVTDNISDPNNQLKAQLTIVSVATGATYKVVVPYEKVPNGTQALLGQWDTKTGANGDYLITVSAVDQAGNTTNDALPANSIRVTVVNNTLSQKVTLGGGSFVDQFGFPLTATYDTTSPDTNFLQTHYIGGASWTLTQLLRNATSSTFTEVVNSAASSASVPVFYTGTDTQTVQKTLVPNSSVPGTVEGRYQLQLVGSQNTVTGNNVVANGQSSFVPVDVILDRTPPTVTISAPQSGPGNIAIVPPGGLLTLTFTVKNTPGTGLPQTAAAQSLIAPLTKIFTSATAVTPLDVPKFTLTIPQLNRQFNVLKAIQTPDLVTLNTNGSIKFQNNGDGSYTITWQLPIQSQIFAYGQTYSVVVGGVQDVVNNMANNQTVQFQVLN